MSRGLGRHQRGLKAMVRNCHKLRYPATWSQLEKAYVVKAGGDPDTDELKDHVSRSLRRALLGMVKSGDLLRLGAGGQVDPYRYVAVEDFTGEEDTKTAKAVYAEMAEAAAHFSLPNR